LPGWLRQYGRPPFAVAVLHGGPGAPGYMAPVARELSAERGVVEPLQAADSLQRQVEELRAILVDNASLPVVLVGSSWGAMLGFILSARHPELVQKLVMVGCPVFGGCGEMPLNYGAAGASRTSESRFDVRSWRSTAITIHTWRKASRAR
jgi:pimeloyl-ACP methyl ester carboxylesterase